MHSTLAPHLHSKDCADLIEAFEKCHKEYRIGKFFGKCNDLKYQLGKCFAEDTKERRRQNREKSIQQRKSFEKKYSEYLKTDISTSIYKYLKEDGFSKDYLMGVPLTTVYSQDNNTNRQTNLPGRHLPTTRLIEVMPADERKKEGELLKYKNVFSGWGKRYFRLERTYLHYFETKHSHKPLATITRGEISQVKHSNAFNERKFVFEIQQKNGVIWYCQAQTHDEMLSWMQALSPVPFVVPDPYPVAPCVHPPPVAPPMNNNDPPPRYNSPYRDLTDQAHHVAFMSNTPHECIHESPPPPYTPGYHSPR